MPFAPIFRGLPVCASTTFVFSGFATSGVREHCTRLGADLVFDKADPGAFLRWLSEAAGSGPPLVLLLDDLQLAGKESGELLTFLGEDLRSSRVTQSCTSRARVIASARVAA